MIAAMERVEVVFLRSELDAMIAFLQEQGVMHMEDVPLALENYPGYLHRVHLPRERKEEFDTLEELRRLAREAMPLLAVTPLLDAVDAAARDFAGDNPDIEAWGNTVRMCHRTLRSLARRRLNIQDNKDVLRNYRRVLENVAPLMAERRALLGVTAKAMIIPAAAAEDLDDLEKQIIRDVGPECDLARRMMDRTNIVAVVTHPAGRGDAVGEILRERGIIPLDVPDKTLTGITIEEALRRIDAKLRGFDAELERLGVERAEFSLAQGPALHALDRAITDRLAQLSVVRSLAESRLVTVVHGWIPTDTYEAFRRAVQQRFGAQAVVGRLPQTELDRRRIPTLLRNYGIFKPFQLILRMFDPPKYGTLDPTWIVAISFVLFYGFILGDAGYGLFIVGVAAWAKRRWGRNELMRDAFSIAQWMGASSIVWGIVYGEFFGNLPELYLGLHPLFHRMHQPLVLLGVAVGYGIVHVPISLVLGAVEGYRHGHREHAEE
ncbi:MAG TPA: V-type ATPase 116kDa subunit family protein, partial [Candidatus Hydrogenedentes bacterium]|nr:V-type ATPase 116kDa subunit family protein [Candidatus Hydrogenedentota bacterium]